MIKGGVKIARARENLCKLAEDVRIKLYVVDVRECNSNTGRHRVGSAFIKPFTMTRNYDFYIAEPRLVVRPASVEGFLAETEEFTVENLLDISSHM